MESNESIKPERREQDEVSPADIKQMLAEIMTQASDGYLVEISERIESIKDHVMDKYVWSDRRMSPYWHALASSTMKVDESAVVNPLKQREIAETIIGSLKRLVASFAVPEAAHESSNALIRDIATFRESLVTKPVLLHEFNTAVYQHILELQKKYPHERLTQIPEIQYLISGSEVVSDEGIAIETIGEVMLSVTEKYLEVKDRIEAELSLGSEERS